MKALPPSPPAAVQIKIGNATMRVPVCVDEETTLEIVQRVNQRLKQVEEKATRIDTQAFALQTAYELAADLYLSEREHERDVRDLAKALDKIATQLSALAEEFAPAEKPERKKD